MNKLRICFGLLTAFLFGTLVVQAEIGAPERPIADQNPSFLWGTAAGHGSLPTQAPQIRVQAPALPGSKDTPKASESSDSKYKTPGQEMKKNPDLRKNILTAQANAFDKDQEKFEKEARKGILINVLNPGTDDRGNEYKQVHIKYKSDKKGRYYFYAEESDKGATNPQLSKVMAMLEAKKIAQQVMSDIQNTYVHQKKEKGVALTHVLVTDNSCSPVLVWRDASGVSYSTAPGDVYLGKYVRPQQEQGMNPCQQVVFELKRMAQANQERMSKKESLVYVVGSADFTDKGRGYLQGKFKEYLGTLVGAEEIEGSRAMRLTTDWKDGDVLYVIHYLSAALTDEEMQELKAWAAKGAQEYELIQVVAPESEEAREISPAEIKKGYEKWEKNYRTLLDKMYISDGLDLRYNPVFGWGKVAKAVQIVVDDNDGGDGAGTGNEADDAE